MSEGQGGVARLSRHATFISASMMQQQVTTLLIALTTSRGESSSRDESWMTHSRRPARRPANQPQPRAQPFSGPASLSHGFSLSRVQPATAIHSPANLSLSPSSAIHHSTHPSSHPSSIQISLPVSHSPVQAASATRSAPPDVQQTSLSPSHSTVQPALAIQPFNIKHLYPSSQPFSSQTGPPVSDLAPYPSSQSVTQNLELQ